MVTADGERVRVRRLPDLFFWLAALLTGAPRGVRQGATSASAADRWRVGILALGFVGLWLFVQSIQL